MQCLHCLHENRPTARFCESCGAALARRCANCGEDVGPHALFCAACGERLPGAAASLGSSAESELELPEGERRQLTVLFCDLVDSTVLSQQVDPEEWRDIIAQYHEAAAGAVERFGGHVAKYLGDGLLIYLGWPAAREDDPERAVRAGLAIVEVVKSLPHRALATIATTSGDERAASLSVRVGMHTGPVVIASSGEIFGETANVAARVQGAAEPDTVVITAATHRLVAGMFVVEDRGPQTLKGVREPVKLYRVVQPSGVRTRLNVVAGRLTRFVGREVEMATLVDRWERAQDGEGQSVLVVGEAGVGKSRLVYHFHEHLAAVPHTWLECGAASYTERTPFHPVIALMSQGLLLRPDDTSAEKLAKLEVGLGALASPESVALLADFLGLTPPAPLQMSPELQRRKTIDLLTQWSLALSTAQPLVVLLEDLHWCDASSLELLWQLVEQSPTARILVLATARLEFTSPWPARSNLTTVQLPRLTKRQSREMVATLGGSALPADTLDALVTRADGVPLYLEELTKAVVEPGTVRGVESIPTTLADSMMARLDRLSAAKEVAQRAAVLGREFGYPLLLATAGLDGAVLRPGLTRLVEAEILFARGEPPAATYTFKHALMQETAYQSLLKRTRQQLHARVAQALQQRFPEQVESEPEVIARHYDQAGLAAEAITHYQRAGERATRRSANEEAIGHLRRALALVEKLPSTRERDQRELGLQMAIGAALVAARGQSHPETERAYARAHELAAHIGDSPELPRLLAGLAAAYFVKGDLATAAQVAHEALAAAERTGDAFDLLASHYLIGLPLLFQGNFLQALEHFQHSIRLYDPGTHAALAYTVGFDPGIDARSHAAWCQWYVGQPDRALTMSEEAVSLAQRVDHPLSLALALFWCGSVHIQRGAFDRGHARADEVVALAERLGFPLYLGLGKFLRGVCRVELGEEEDGIAEMQQAMVELAGIGSGIGAPQILLLLAEDLRKIGRLDDAVGTLGLALAQAESQGQHYYDAELHRLRAEVLLDGDREAVDEAESIFTQSLEIARRQEAKSFELRTVTMLARLWLRQGKPEAARALLAPLCAWFTEGFDTRDLRVAKALLQEL